MHMRKATPPGGAGTRPGRQNTDELIAAVSDVPTGDMLFHSHDSTDDDELEPSRINTNDLIAQASLRPGSRLPPQSPPTPMWLGLDGDESASGDRPQQMSTNALINIAVAAPPGFDTRGGGGHAQNHPTLPPPLSLPPTADLLPTGPPALSRLQSLPRSSASRGGFFDGQPPSTSPRFDRRGPPQDRRVVSAPGTLSSKLKSSSWNGPAPLPSSRHGSLVAPSPPARRVSLGAGLRAESGPRLSSGSTDGVAPTFGWIKVQSADEAKVDPGDNASNPGLADTGLSPPPPPPPPPKVDRNSPGYRKMSVNPPRAALTKVVDRSGLVVPTPRPDADVAGPVAPTMSPGYGDPNSGRRSLHLSGDSERAAPRPTGRPATTAAMRAVSKPPAADADTAPPPVDRNTDYYKTWSPKVSRRGQQTYAQPSAGPVPPKVALP